MKALWLGMTAALTASAAQAALTISTDATSNVTCSGGVCSATTSDAVLNVGDLTNMLAAGSVTVESGDQANDIAVAAPFSWTSSNALTLDADKSITVNKAVADSGPAALTLTYGGKKGDLRFGQKGNISFTSTTNSLTINKTAYALVDSIASLARDIAAHPKGHYALSDSYDAAKDGTYSYSPIPTRFGGLFEGLGNAISHLSIDVPYLGGFDWIGFFTHIGHNGVVRNFSLSSASVKVRDGQKGYFLGILAGRSGGLIENTAVSGSVRGQEGTIAGGLIGLALAGTVRSSHSSASVEANAPGPNNFGDLGGLVGHNFGLIEDSYATGRVAMKSGGLVGGLASVNGGQIKNCYASGSATGETSGGFVGLNDFGPEVSVSASYSTGKVRGSPAGGFVGDDEGQGGFNDAYWDLDTSGVSDPGQGAGNITSDPGITGLTDDGLKSALPTGFDPKIWSQNPKINNGYPYLIANPAAK